MGVEHVVSVSGGKDSTALYLLAMERGRPFKAVFADTDNEHPWTYEAVRDLPRVTGGPEIQWVKADFSHRLANKAKFVAEKWPLHGISADKVERAVAALRPSGNAFLDLYLWKGRFPSTRVRFCTEELKIVPMWEQVQFPAIQRGSALMSWQGVRAQESFARAQLPKMQRLELPYGMKVPAAIRDGTVRYRAWAYRPLLDWKLEDVWAMHARHGVKRNPLYDEGMSRVGCMPCIMANKDELRTIAAKFPAEIERIAEWEELARHASKRGIGSFMSVCSDPKVGRGVTTEELRAQGGYTIHDAVDWSRTSRGGLQKSLLLHPAIEFNTPCNQWGACEAGEAA
ncbi:MAG: phosphoadenosine phosphosulfate reductase [Mesorhizobium amorphae]|nr:MAG: phosphoadenosine phosphosulfate reductase [Mesorhizobium amorphae]